MIGQANQIARAGFIQYNGGQIIWCRVFISVVQQMGFTPLFLAVIDRCTTQVKVVMNTFSTGRAMDFHIHQ